MAGYPRVHVSVWEDTVSRAVQGYLVQRPGAREVIVERTVEVLQMRYHMLTSDRTTIPAVQY